MSHRQHVSERIRPEFFVEDAQKHQNLSIIRAQAPKISYSDRYTDDNFEYRHVTLPTELARIIPKGHLMSEREWRTLGVQQSIGWEHYMIHKPEPHVLLFRRARGYQPTPEAIEAAQRIVASLSLNQHA